MLNMIELLDQTRGNWKTEKAEGKRLAAANASLERENRYAPRIHHGSAFDSLISRFRNLLEEIEAIRGKFRRNEEKIASLLITQEALKSEINGHKKNFETVKNALKVS